MARFTYFAPDIAYHVDKHDRGFDRAIDVWGADHHGYIPRMRACAQPRWVTRRILRVELVQLVTVMRGGEEVKMSKRAGEFVTLRDLMRRLGSMPRATSFLREGRLAARLRRGPGQEANRRESRLLRADGSRPAQRDLPDRRARSRDGDGQPRYAALPAPQDMELSRSWRHSPKWWRGRRASGSRTESPSYLHELATVVHGWYHHTRAVGAPEGEATEQARLLLARAARIVLANGLGLLGISSPDRM